MLTDVAYGLEHLEIEVDEQSLVPTWRQPQSPPLEHPAEAVAEALERPLRFPPLRRALTPDDHVALVVDEEVPRTAELLTPILEHLTDAGVAAESITLVSPPSSIPADWVDDLPFAFEEVRTEVHHPAERKRLSYLATTRGGRRIYLNRTVVDADQIVVLTRRGYDPMLGYSGAEGSLYPLLADEATLQEARGKLSLGAPGQHPWPLQQEAQEVAWLVGMPFLVQVIEGSGAEVSQVLAGPLESSREGQQLLDARWRIEVEQAADTVIASLGGDPAAHRFEDLARAAACAARVVKPGGCIILLSGGEPALGEGAEHMRRLEDAGEALRMLLKHQTADQAAVFQWASAARHAKLYLYSRLAGEVVEELFAVPIDAPGQVQRLLGGGSCLILADSHKTMAVVRSTS
jgi:nickel-dependent lactate racemase